MKTSTIVAAGLLATALGAGSAGAASEQEAVGKIMRLSPRTQSITVGKHVYRYDPHHTAHGLRSGQSVRVLYRIDHGHRVASRILPAAG